jgi:zinc protease
MKAPVTIVEKDPGLPLLHLSLSFRRGQDLDPPGKEGASRLLLRLMRRSVRGITPEAIDERLDALGATLATDASRAASTISGGCISRSTNEFLALVHKVVCEPDFSADEFDRLVKESLAAWTESLDNDSAVARRFFVRALFRGHPYEKLLGGTKTSLTCVTLSDLKELYESTFHQNRACLALAGDISPDSAEEIRAQLLGSLPEANLGKFVQVEPPGPTGRHLTFVDKPERSQTQILIGCLGTHPTDDDHMPLFVGHTIFGGTFSARLSREVRGKRGWSYGAYSDLPFDKMRQGFSLWTFPQASDAAACIQLELELLEQFIEQGILEEELEAAKKYLKNSHVFSVDTAEKRAHLSLDRFIYDLPVDYHATYLERILAVTKDDVDRALRRRLSATNLEITVLGTYSEIGRDIERSIPDLEGTDVVPFDRPD